MALVDEVTARLSNSLLVRLTNPDSTGNAVDTDRLAAAIADVEAEFPTYAGEEFDLDNDAHVSLAVEGVEARLRFVATGHDEKWRAFLDRLEAYASAGPRARVTPRTTSELTPSRERTGTETVRPAFDHRRFDDYAPTAPVVGDDDDGG
jgi:hypothetical protein